VTSITKHKNVQSYHIGWEFIKKSNKIKLCTKIVKPRIVTLGSKAIMGAT